MVKFCNLLVLNLLANVTYQPSTFPPRKGNFVSFSQRHRQAYRLFQNCSCDLQTAAANRQAVQAELEEIFLNGLARIRYRARTHVGFSSVDSLIEFGKWQGRVKNRHERPASTATDTATGVKVVHVTN